MPAPQTALRDVSPQPVELHLSKRVESNLHRFFLTEALWYNTQRAGLHA